MSLESIAYVKTKDIILAFMAVYELPKALYSSLINE